MNLNRLKLIERLNAGVSNNLKLEIDYFMGKTHNDHYDIVNAFEDTVNFIENNHEESNLTTEIKLIFIQIGLCCEVDIARIMETDGRRYWYKYKGKYYECNIPWANWINN